MATVAASGGGDAHARSGLSLVLALERPRGRPEDASAAAADQQVLLQLSLWLADVAAEAAPGVRPPEAAPAPLDTASEQGPARKLAR